MKKRAEFIWWNENKLLPLHHQNKTTSQTLNNYNYGYSYKE